MNLLQITRNSIDWFLRKIHLRDKPTSSWTPIWEEEESHPLEKKDHPLDEHSEYSSLADLTNDIEEIMEFVKKLKRTKGVHNFHRIKSSRIYMSNPTFKSDDGLVLYDEEAIESTYLAGFKTYGFPTVLAHYSRDTEEGWNGRHISYAEKGKSFPPHYPPIKDHVYYSWVITIENKDNKDIFSTGFVVKVNTVTGEVCPMKSIEDSFAVVGKHRTVIRNKTKYYANYVTNRAGEQVADAIDEQRISKLVLMFKKLYADVMHRETGINVNLRRGKRRVTFIVQSHEWKSFFKDRLKTKTKTGRTKPIFHAVSAHQRITKNGIQNVKTYYKGVRKFFWNNCEVVITMPEKHGASQSIMQITPLNEDDLKNTKRKTISFDEMEDRIDELGVYG